MDTPQARLNPFLFPSSTNFRFALLILAVTGASLFIYDYQYFQKYTNEVFQIIQECSQDAANKYPLNNLNPDTPEYIDQQNLQLNEANICREPYEQHKTKWVFIRLGILYLVAFIIYWFTPNWRMWRDMSVVFTTDDDPEIMKCLEELCQDVKLSKAPIILLRPLDPSPSGLAFGRLGSYYILLNGGLVSLFYVSPERFRAIVRHELAHLQNKDVDKTYFSVALTISFFFISLLPFVFSIVTNVTLGPVYILGNILRAFLFIIVIYIVLASILRSREIYADVRASENNEAYSILQKEFSTPAHKAAKWNKFLRLHPDPSERAKALVNTHLLFEIGYWDAFVIGIITTFGLSPLENFSESWFPPEWEQSIGPLLIPLPTLFPTFILTLFVVLAVGVGVWQMKFASRFFKGNTKGMGRLGLSLGMGMLLGLSISFSSSLNLETETQLPYSFIVDGIFQVAWRMVFLFGLFFVFRWSAANASVWLETVSSKSNLQGLIYFGLFVTACVLCFWMAEIILIQKLGYMLVLSQLFNLFNLSPVLVSEQSISETSKLILNVTQSSAVILSYCAVPFLIPLFLFPLTAKFRKARTNIYDLTIENKLLTHIAPTHHHYIRLFSAFFIGLGTALVFVLFMGFLQIILVFVVPQSLRMTNEWELQFGHIQIYIAVFVQVSLAILVSVLYKQIGWAHGMFAAFVAGCLIQLGVVGLYELGDCITFLGLIRPYTCEYPFDTLEKFNAIVILGTSFSFPLALFASWISSLFRNSFSKPSPS